jgi:hypothetical protein
MTSKQLRRAAIDVADKYVAQLHRKEIVQMYREWRAGIPEGFFKRFIKVGIEPFLKGYGYQMNTSYSQIEQFCKEWAFAHVQIQRKGGESLQRTFLKAFHDGGEEEYDWFMFTIPSDDWMEFANGWSYSEFLDDSEAGYAQRMDLPLFVWRILDLAGSKRHHKWLEFNTDDDEDEIVFLQAVQTNDEGRAFGGDRRTL